MEPAFYLINYKIGDSGLNSSRNEVGVKQQ
jgi:hypothetical protein